MKPKRTIVIELAGGPGAGKSTDVAQIYASLKRRGVDVEMAREHIKRYVYEGTTISALDELYILGAQTREESRLLGNVDVVVSDRPVFLSAVFGDLYSPAAMQRGLRAAVMAYYETSRQQGHRRVVVLLPRRGGYVTSGRWENEQQALRADAVVEQVVGELVCGVGVAGLYRFGVEGCDVEDVVVDVDRLVRYGQRNSRALIQRPAIT